MKKVLFVSLISLILIGCGSSESDTQVNSNETIIASDNEESPIETSQETFEINGVNHFIEKIGSGDPIIVLHGGPGINHDYLLPHFKTLAKNYQIIFYDQRACGKTDFPSDTSSINIETYVEDLEALRNHLKIKKIKLLGHSWGALLALKYSLKYPENLDKLILVAPAPSNSDYFDQTFANMQQKRKDEDTKELIQTMMSKEFENRDQEAFRKVLLLGDKTNLVDQKNIEELYRPMTFTSDAANSLLIVSSLLERTFFNFDITNEGLDKINCQTLLIIGDLDNVPFLSNQAIQEGIAGCELKVLKKCAHHPYFESPKEFNKSINDFLNPDYVQ
ncbi:MAG: alpha/beta fold hydrolase [Vicingaceae bacterium]|nr:alpha/beta fold hydrolase [Vicingaceae bacterium]